MAMLTDRMIGEYKEYNMYANDIGMYYFSELVQGCFITKAFDTIEDMKEYIDNLN